MDEMKEGCGCLVISCVIVGICWIAVNVLNSGSDSAAPSAVPTYTTLIYSPPTESERIYTAPTVDNPVLTQSHTSVTATTPDDAYDEGYDEGYYWGLEDGRSGESYGFSYDDYSGYDDCCDTSYQEGYDDGYNDGYYEGKDLYEEEEYDG